MNRLNRRVRNGARVGVTALALSLLASGAWTQTPITAPKNKFSPSDDVKLGQEAAGEVRSQLPLLTSSDVDNYVGRVGNRLVESIAPQFRHPEFRYSFDVVNAKDINAFALPGGPMFVNRGIIEAAKTEGELAGVMAHELSHVALRHGTAQATKAQKFQMGALAGAVLGAIIGGNTGRVVAEGTQFGVGTYFLKFSREYEKQADLLGAQIMAAAGYDPRDLANMFRTIEQQAGSSGPQWLSDHPNPGNRYAYINAEARLLTVRNPVRDAGEFTRAQAELRRMVPALSSEEIARKGAKNPSSPGGSGGRVEARVEPPSSRYQTYDEGDLFRVSVPVNWRELPAGNSVRFAPQGAFGQVRGQEVFTHGVEIGLVRNEGHALQEATDEFIASLAQSNPNLRRGGSVGRRNLGGRPGLVNVLSNLSDATGRREIVTVRTALLRDGSLFYAISVAPEDEHTAYARTFDRVASSIQLRG